MYGRNDSDVGKCYQVGVQVGHTPERRRSRGRKEGKEGVARVPISLHEIGGGTLIGLRQDCFSPPVSPQSPLRHGSHQRKPKAKAEAGW